MHLAALEHFLKNDERGQEILQGLEEGHEEKEAVETKGDLGWQIFWTESCLQNQNVPMNYRLWGKWSRNQIISCGLLRSAKSIAKNTTSIRDIPLF